METIKLENPLTMLSDIKITNCKLQPASTQLTAEWANNLITTCAINTSREVIVKNIKAIRCPCCGAPVSKSADHNCDYCGMYLSLEKEEI